MARQDAVRQVEVVLDDEPAPVGGAVTDGPAAPAASAAPGPRRRWPAAAGAVLLALVLALAAVDARADRREAAALAAHADVPDVLASLAEPPTQAWRLPVFPPLATTGDVVVAVDGADVVGLDAATGERRWTTSRPPGSVRPTCLPSMRPAPPAPDDVASHVLCTGLEPGLGGWVAVDVATGALGLPVGPVLALGAVEGGALVVRPGDPSALTAALLDLHGPDEGVRRDGERTTTERWSVPLDMRGDVLGNLVVHGDRQVVSLESTTTVVLDARDGRALGRWVAASDGVARAVARVVSHPGAGFGVWESRYAGRWYAPDGTPGAVLDGEPVEPQIDDGRTPGVVLLGSAAGDRVRAVDVRSGDEVWDRPAPGRVLLRLGDRLVVSTGTRLEAWDAATGEVRWSVALDRGEVPNLGAPWTDGVRLVMRGEDEDGLRLTAYRLDDGARVWRSPLPAGSRFVAVLGDRLVAVGGFDGRTDAALVLR